MTIPDTVDLLAGVPLVVIVPALVDLARQQGLPSRYGGLASIAVSTVLLALAGFALDPHLQVADVARWLVGGVVYGLAASGLYSQRKALTSPPPQRDAGEERPPA